MLKWSEPAYDFYHQGYDVLLFDHRGQGYFNPFVDRILKKDIYDRISFLLSIDMAKII